MFKPSDNRKVILASEAQGTIDALVAQCASGNIPYSILELATREAKQALNNHKRSTGEYEQKYYIGLEVGLAAYERMLEVGGEVEDVLVFAAVECEEDIEKVLGAKHRPFYYSRAVVDRADSHPVQRKMLRERHMDKTALKCSRTISQQLRRLSLYIDLHKRITALEDKVDDLESRTVVQEVTTTIQNKRLNALDKAIGSGYDEKDTAIELSILGYSNKQIADVIKKHPKTISRWLTEHEDKSNSST